MLHFYARNQRGHNTMSSCHFCKPKTQGEYNALHLLPFVVGFAIRSMHTHKQQKQYQSKKRKKMKEKFTSFNENCYRKTKKT
jgi:hypothetical protein